MTVNGVHLFVDNSNVLIEGRRLSFAKRQAGGRRTTDVNNSYEIDWGKFLHLVKSRGSRLLAKVPKLYGSRPPPDDTIWQEIRREGFDVQVFNRNFFDKEKGVDMTMGLDVGERLVEVVPPEILVLAAGDADFIPAIERARKKGWNVEVWFWGNAAEEMRSAATFVNMDPAFDYLQKGGGVPLPPLL